ncbi:MAG TPA: hypothetical protein VJU02_01645 [Nitrospiraceae bacterium]|nr:hypothetical protein [Nitrospiraceae bacterium]
MSTRKDQPVITSHPSIGMFSRLLKKEGKGSLVVLLLAERARSEGARSTRAIEDQPDHPFENGSYIAAALPAERRVLDFGELSRAARRG